jgi:hypothetical protein
LVYQDVEIYRKKGVAENIWIDTVD